MTVLFPENDMRGGFASTGLPLEHDPEWHPCFQLCQFGASLECLMQLVGFFGAIFGFAILLKLIDVCISDTPYDVKIESNRRKFSREHPDKFLVVADYKEKYPD